ncbi:MAG: phosphate ABC transporter substrate-binding protein PstS [Chloroflexi bacterium]|nr:phosphate ABC transporter substrate-binding protein PstS [Chloroflexota bacterium]
MHLASAQVALNGAGATFPAPLYTKWFNEYATRTGVQVNYQPIGSGGGIKAITDRTVDFGATDGIMTAEQQAAAPDVLHIPMVAGSVVLAFNVPELEGKLNLSPDTVAGIFLGTIGKWNDAALAADNPGVALPNKDIISVHRSDSSGTTFIFTNYLTKISPAWAAQVGNATSVNWPNGLGGQGNSGVAGEVKANEGSIGYVELAYAVQNNIPVASVKNASGVWVTASYGSTTAAAAGVALPDDMKVMITNSSNPDAYPIAGFTWILVNREQTDQAKGKAVVDMLLWAIKDGQQLAVPLNYAPLSAEAAARAEAQIRSITFQGTPLAN